MRIGLDLDGVVYQFDKTAQYMIARHRGLATREELVWDHSEYYRGIPKADWDWLFSRKQVDPLFRHGHLYRGAIEGVRELAKLGEVVVITKRPKRATRVTLEWLTFHWGDAGHEFPFSEIHVLQGGDKSAIPCDIYIDDREDVVVELLAETTAEVVLVSRPWNNVYRIDAALPVATDALRVAQVKEWSDIVDCVKWYGERRMA